MSPRYWLIATHSLAILLLTCSTSDAQFQVSRDSPFLRAVRVELEAGECSNALTIIRANESTAPSDHLAEALLSLSQLQFQKEQYVESLALLNEITDVVADDSFTSLAWLGKGEVYHAQRDFERMVAALERGLAAKRVGTSFNIMDASDTHNRAYDMLGKHFLETKQWKKALANYSAWKPSSWCGTCAAYMDSSRRSRVVYCLIQLGRHDEAVDEILKQGILSDTGLLFVLVRLYEEANQSIVLKRLLTKAIVARRARDQRSALKITDVERRTRVQSDIEADSQKFIETLTFAMSFQRKTTLEAAVKHISVDPVVVQQLGPGSMPEDRFRSTMLHDLAMWKILSDSKDAVPALVKASREKKAKLIAIAEALAEIDSPAARSALVKLAVSGDVHKQRNVCGVILSRCENSSELIEQVNKLVPEVRRRYSTRNADPAPFESNFYRPWPLPQDGSLPTAWPASDPAE